MATVSGPDRPESRGNRPSPLDTDRAHTPGREHPNSAGHHHGHARGHGHRHRHGSGGWARVRHFFVPHSHDSADSVDEALERSAEGIRALKISLIALGVTAALQALVVLVSGSVALLADTLHNLGDALTAVPLWIAFVLGRRGANRRYTYGYGRAEDIAGVFILLAIAASAAVTAYESVDRLLHPRSVESLWLVFAAGIIGFLGNELVAVYRIRVGRRIGSAALVADGLHARTDGLTSLAVVAGAAGVAVGFPLADPLVGLAICAAMVVILAGAAREIYGRLMDSVDPALVDQAESVLRTVPGVMRVDTLRLRWVGHRLRAEVAIRADHRLSLVAAHDLADTARAALVGSVPKLVDALVHVSPSATTPEVAAR
ncbi:cation diffusion facilitator family transporter [Micromonospora echinaurantiaca]|uniref:cation diffusion facilitator family transporter n=1 Tax=Micromonospora echinaurantiaca TaxID=47857 RepID=UPI0037B47E12